jgi:hypothetical protein
LGDRLRKPRGRKTRLVGAAPDLAWRDAQQAHRALDRRVVLPVSLDQRAGTSGSQVGSNSSVPATNAAAETTTSPSTPLPMASAVTARRSG